MSDKWIFIISFGGTFALMGIIFTAIALVFVAARSRTRSRCSYQTTGKIIDIARTRNGLSPVYEYEADGKRYIQQCRYGGFPVRYYIGQDVNVYYDPYNSYFSFIENDFTENIMIKTFMIVGLTFLIIGITSSGIVWYSM